MRVGTRLGEALDAPCGSLALPVASHSYLEML